MTDSDLHTRQYLKDFRMLSNVLFALCMFASVLTIQFTRSDMAEPDLLALLKENMVAVGNFVVAFMFLAMYWVKFVGKMYYIKHSNARLLVLWLMYLAVVCLYPFAENLLGNFPGSPVAQIFFSGLWAVIGVLALLNWWYANRAGLTDPDMDEKDATRLYWESFPEPVAALVSIPFALFSDLGYYAVMLAILPANLWISRRFAD